MRVPLGQNYTSLTESLWYPPATLGTSSTATVTPYDANNLEVPRAMGGTCYAMALMLAYNQFSSNSSLQTYNTGQSSTRGDAGGNGRNGAQKIIIFETDGAPNTTASANFNNNGAYQSYYSVRYNSTSPSEQRVSHQRQRLQRQRLARSPRRSTACARNWPPRAPAGGYSTPSRPLLIHCLAFGPQGTNGAADASTRCRPSATSTTACPATRSSTAPPATIISNLQTAIDKILQDGVQVSLIQ